MGVRDLVGQEKIAYPHWKRPQSKLRAGVGVMPGVKLKPVDKMKLKSGRGVIP